ncbi:MAG: hypothetical protein FJW40_07195 [Acidobacteria bacterium]|nr:hypothetical protein [Acidobacteriota bacterium]
MPPPIAPEPESGPGPAESAPAQAPFLAHPVGPRIPPGLTAWVPEELLTARISIQPRTPAPPAWSAPRPGAAILEYAPEEPFAPALPPADEEHHISAFLPDSFAYNDQTIEVYWGRWAGRTSPSPRPAAALQDSTELRWEPAAPSAAMPLGAARPLERVEVHAPATPKERTRGRLPAGVAWALAPPPAVAPGPLRPFAVAAIAFGGSGLRIPGASSRPSARALNRRGWTRLPISIRPPLRCDSAVPKAFWAAPAARIPALPLTQTAVRRLRTAGARQNPTIGLASGGMAPGTPGRLTEAWSTPLAKSWTAALPRGRFQIGRPQAEIFEPPPLQGALAIQVLSAAAALRPVAAQPVPVPFREPGLAPRPRAPRIAPGQPPRATRLQALRPYRPIEAAAILALRPADPERKPRPARLPFAGIELWRLHTAPPKPSVMDWLSEIPMSRKLVGVLLPAVLATGLEATAYLKAGIAPELRAQIVSRAAIDLREDFQGGLDRWTEGAQSWRLDTSGAATPRTLALLRPSLGLRDYVVEFQGQIEAKALGWVFRAPDDHNYYAMKLVVLKDGPLPSLGFVRYAVLSGRMMEKVELPFPFQTRADTVYRVRLTIEGSSFVTRIQDRIIDTWTDARLAAGGVGFFSEAGERARLRSLIITHQNDLPGMFCARLAAWLPEHPAGVPAP